MSGEGGDDDFVFLRWVFHKRCNGCGRGGFDVKAHFGHSFLGVARFAVVNGEDVASRFVNALDYLGCAGGFGDGDAFGDGCGGFACPVGHKRGAMGGLHGDEFGQVGDQILFEQVGESDVSTDQERSVSRWYDECVWRVEIVLFPDFISISFGAVEEKGVPDMACIKVFLRRVLDRMRGVFPRTGDFVQVCAIALDLREFCR